MTSVARRGLLLAVMLTAIAAMAATAQAVIWYPDNTFMTGDADDPTLSYGTATFVCDTGSVEGATGLDSATIADVAFGLQGSCSGTMSATVDCGDSTVNLTALTNDPPGGWGTLGMADLECQLVTGICTITLAGPEDPGGTFVLDETADTLSIDSGDLTATRQGSVLCGPQSSTGSIAATYATHPSSLAIDP
jgi:hypothetical protein